MPSLADFLRAESEASFRQPVHTVYGGAHLFTPGICAKLGSLALRSLETNGPFPGIDNRTADLVRTKLREEPVEDYRIDFEDGYGDRPPEDEDSHAAAAAKSVAEAMRDRIVPPCLGIRIKPLSDRCRARSLRTLHIFLSVLLENSGGLMPPNFVVTLPKIETREEPRALADALDEWEPLFGLPMGTLKFELMVETPEALQDLNGILDAARGRCSAAHFGAYDYLACLEISSTRQHLLHPACDFARNLMKQAFSGRGIFLSDGATHRIPVGDRAAVSSAWELHFAHVRHALDNGFHQGWDLHPAQLVSRFAAVFSFFREDWEVSAARLANFLGQSSRAALTGSTFDDSASARGLAIHLTRALKCRAISYSEIDRMVNPF